jgi:hypothetical protein
MDLESVGQRRVRNVLTFTSKKVVNQMKDVPVEKVREVVKEVPVEVVKEVAKEIPVEKVCAVQVGAGASTSKLEEELRALDAQVGATDDACVLHAA